MESWTFSQWVFHALPFVFGLFGGFLASYMNEKGKNLATRDDVERITKLQEEIRSEISGKMWSRQKNWELKKEVLLDAVSELSGLQSSAARLVASRAALAVTGEWALSSSPMWIKVSDEFIEVSSRFKTVRLKIEIACSETAATSFRNLDLNLDSALSDLQDTAKMVKGVADFQKAIPGLLKVVRQELET